ncbi:hypothetical protein Bca4012_058453 [Brassica carinata]
MRSASSSTSLSTKKCISAIFLSTAFRRINPPKGLQGAAGFISACASLIRRIDLLISSVQILRSARLCKIPSQVVVCLMLRRASAFFNSFQISPRDSSTSRFE